MELFCLRQPATVFIGSIKYELILDTYEYFSEQEYRLYDVSYFLHRK